MADADWNRQSPAPALQVLSFASGTTAVLTPAGASPDGLAKGDLWIETAQGRTHIAGSVTDLAPVAMANGA